MVASQVVRSVPLHIQHFWKLEVTVYLYFLHLVVVELKPLQHYYQDIRQLLYAEPLQRLHLLLARLAVVRIIPVQNLPLHETLQGLLKALLPSDVEAN